MNLLLLLSALFSALAGMGGAVRAPDAVQAVAGSPVVQAATAAVVRPAANRPVAAAPTWIAMVRPLRRPSPLLVVARAVPLWADRRRE